MNLNNAILGLPGSDLRIEVDPNTGNIFIDQSTITWAIQDNSGWKVPGETSGLRFESNLGVVTAKLKVSEGDVCVRAYVVALVEPTLILEVSNEAAVPIAFAYSVDPPMYQARTTLQETDMAAGSAIATTDSKAVALPHRSQTRIAFAKYDTDLEPGNFPDSATASSGALQLLGSGCVLETEDGVLLNAFNSAKWSILQSQGSTDLAPLHPDLGFSIPQLLDLITDASLIGATDAAMQAGTQLLLAREYDGSWDNGSVETTSLAIRTLARWSLMQTDELFGTAALDSLLEASGLLERQLAFEQKKKWWSKPPTPPSPALSSLAHDALLFAEMAFLKEGFVPEAKSVSEVAAIISERYPIGAVPAPTDTDVQNVVHRFVFETPTGLVLLPNGDYNLPKTNCELNMIHTCHGKLSVALRWHDQNPAVLWSLDPSNGEVPIACGLDVEWVSSQTDGEALFAGI